MGAVKLTKEIRRNCDKLLNETKRLYDDMLSNLVNDQGLLIPRGPLHEFVFMAYIGARDAKAWTGKAIQFLTGEGSPYAVANKPENIPAEDCKVVDEFIYCSKCHAENLTKVLDAVNSLRAFADITINLFDEIRRVEHGTKEDNALQQCYNDLQLYRFRLGYALGILRDATSG